MKNASSLRLTNRESDMLQGVILGLSNKEIATRYNVAPNTVKVYVSRLSDKLGISGRHAIAIWGRAYVDGQRRIEERFNELHPEHSSESRTWEGVEIATHDVLKSLAQMAEITSAHRLELIEILMMRGR